jgi:hypothetical protein
MVWHGESATWHRESGPRLVPCSVSRHGRGRLARTSGDVARAADGHHKGRDGSGQPVLSDLVARRLDGACRVRVVLVRVCWADGEAVTARTTVTEAPRERSQRESGEDCALVRASSLDVSLCARACACRVCVCACTRRACTGLCRAHDATHNGVEYPRLSMRRPRPRNASMTPALPAKSPNAMSRGIEPPPPSRTHS